MQSAEDSNEDKTQAGEAVPDFPKLGAKLDSIAAIWLVLFILGGGLLALYYSGIGYFPEVSWQGALTYMSLMTIIGGSLFMAYGFLLFIPGAIWSEFLIFDSHFEEILLMQSRKWQPCVLSVIKRIVFPFVVFMFFCHLLLFLQASKSLPGLFVTLGATASLAAVSALIGKDLRLELAALRSSGSQGSSADSGTIWLHRLHVGASHVPLLVAFIVSTRKAQFDPTVLWVTGVLPLASFIALLISGLRTSRQMRLHDPSSTDNWSLLCRSIVAFSSSALLSLVALWFFHRIYRGATAGASGQGIEVPWSLLLLCIFVVTITNLAVSVLFHLHRRRALTASFLAALLLLGAGHLLGEKSNARLPAKIMERFGFGGKRAMLVLTEEGGRLLCQHAVPVEFERKDLPQSDAPGTDPGSGTESTEGKELESDGTTDSSLPKMRYFARAVDLEVLSRLGDEYVLRHKGRMIVLPKGEVVSWSVSQSGEEIEIKNLCAQQAATALPTPRH